MTRDKGNPYQRKNKGIPAAGNVGGGQEPIPIVRRGGDNRGGGHTPRSCPVPESN